MKSQPSYSHLFSQTYCTNLYGHSMMEPLPTGEYAWMSQEAIDIINWERQSRDQDYGFIVEVDLNYPDHLHKSHDSFPLAPEQLDIDYTILSPYSRNCLRYYRPRDYKKYKTRKLCSTFRPRKKYVCHYRNLKLYLELGMELVRVHRAIKFRQRPFLKRIVLRNTEKRRVARTAFERTHWKNAGRNLPKRDTIIFLYPFIFKKSATKVVLTS